MIGGWDWRMGLEGGLLGLLVYTHAQARLCVRVCVFCLCVSAFVGACVCVC